MDDTPRRLSDEELRNTHGAKDEGLDEDSARTVRELRSEIAQTRADMSETIDAIQEKLRPGHIAAAAADRVKDAATAAARDVAAIATEKAEDAMETTRRMADRLVDDGRMNRIAGALVGIGAAWLLVERWRRSAREQYWRREHGMDYDYDVESGPWREGVVGESVQRASATARHMGDRAAESAHRVRSGFERLLHSNPLMVGAAAIAVGATVGLALPETETENEWLGETRDTVVERAQGVATEMRQAAGDIAGQVASEVVGGRQDFQP
jgi:hypothetical protein